MKNTKSTLALVLILLITFNLIAYSNTIFSDISETDWFYNYVIEANNRNVMTGYDGKFRPDDNVTRAELAKVIHSIYEDIDSKPTVESILQSIVYVNHNDIYGSGAVILDGSYILTASHIVKGLNVGGNAKIITPDNKELQVELIKVDTVTDLALLKIAIAGIRYPPYRLSDKQSEVLDIVYIVGSPLEVRNTITKGIVSKVDIFSLDNMANLTQLDATVNYGNSGGALLNSSGELVGIIVSMVDPDIGTGIGYALQLSKIREFIDGY